jgi:signal transduction histidine kinase
MQRSQSRTNINQAVNSLIAEVKEKYPDVSDDEIMKIMNGSSNASEDFVKKYGIEITQESILMKNDEASDQYYLYSTMLIIGSGLLAAAVLFLYQRHENQKINDIIKSLEEINQKNYSLEMDSNDESDLSILKNELYKTTITLKEESENAKNDKSSIKTSMEDISHQLKTPLTSINIMLDNLMDDPDMDQETRNEFIADIKKETMNINFLVQSLLKLSRFDVNSVVYSNQDNSLQEIIAKAVQNSASLSDLMNITVTVNVPAEIHLFCDFNWQVEALTNIIKNSIEHSYEGNAVVISGSQTKLYTEIRIQDTGSGIEPEDLKHIFDRFYRGRNASKESIGIGLSLAKTIIEKNNGRISVETEPGRGTAFIIRYVTL